MALQCSRCGCEIKNRTPHHYMGGYPNSPVCVGCYEAITGHKNKYAKEAQAIADQIFGLLDELFEGTGD